MNIRSTPTANYNPVLPGSLAIDLPPISLGFLSQHNPYDRTAFSGTVYFAAKALDALPGVQLKVLGPHRPSRLSDRLLRRRTERPDPKRLNLDGLDAIVSLVSTPLVDSLTERTGLPLLHVTDATPAFLRTAYGWNIPQTADAAEARVTSKASAVIYSSAFMARQAQNDFGTDLVPHVAPFGINFEKTPETCPIKPGLERLELLFVGSDWDRKGGAKALATLDALTAAGTTAHLTVVGRMPNALRRHPNITYVGFLDKNRPREAVQLGEIYTRAHVLLLPSKADCTPMVLAEAMAHGTPVLATDTGGIAEMIGMGQHGAGHAFASSTSPIIWAAEIRALTADPEAYRAASLAAFEHSRLQLSWQAWGEKIKMIAQTTVFGRI